MELKKYLAEKSLEFQKYVVEVVGSERKKQKDEEIKEGNPRQERFADIEARIVDLMSGPKGLINMFDCNECFYEEMETENWQRLNDFVYQEMLERLIPGCFDGEDHCQYLFPVLASFTCGAEHIAERVCPCELGLTENGYLFRVAGSNMIMAIYYRDKEMLKQAISTAEKFVNSKATKWEKCVIQFLLNIISKDFEAANKNLQDVCKGYMRLQDVEFDMFSIRDFCMPAHGLYCIAEKWLTKEEFAQIEMPTHKTFLKGYAQWRMEHPHPSPNPYIVYPKEMDIVNKIYAMPVAKSVLFEHRWTEQSKLRLAIDSDKMYQNFVEDLRKMR